MCFKISNEKKLLAGVCVVLLNRFTVASCWGFAPILSRSFVSVWLRGFEIPFQKGTGVTPVARSVYGEPFAYVSKTGERLLLPSPFFSR